MINYSSRNRLQRTFHFPKLHVDLVLMFGIITLFCLGLLIIYSAKSEVSILEKQSLRFLCACLIMIGVAQIPPRLYRIWAPWLYCAGLIMLVLVLVAGGSSKGAQRWLNLGFIRFQPSELMKIAIPLMVARYLHAQILPPSLKQLFVPSIIILVPTMLVAMQPDLGTAILVASAGFLVIFFAGIRWKTILTLGVLGISSMPVLWYVLHGYQRERILTLFNPERDPLGTGYHIIQSKIALGAGGLYGNGWLNGTQSQLEFLPESSTDFIFAVLGEEFGLTGALLLLIIYGLIIIRGLYIGVQAQDTFCRLVAGSLIMTFFVYVFVNIGMVSGILPVVGIPLPLISYGGTSLVTIMISFGILMSIWSHKTLVGK